MSPVRVELHLLSAINVHGTLEGCGLKKCALAVTAMAVSAGSSNPPASLVASPIISARYCAMHFRGGRRYLRDSST